ncbi:hypothetical protein PNEG_01235 [Pneumocystis murina B123]|uniref:Kri1-like C-terminal domain-containing protein n=1 Tax=Pneumocystis murina (strain B123) TaxID=1069680 RepID=M7P9I0_PNEMU|nr:hypothetical protein PNEG_01235 [Pneumocystis murina B123]EMR10525.1 hypothetical protein PNEG_01235 [Pneumocystis murina B123]
MHLLSDHDDSDDLDKIVINEAYARRYQHNKAREELHRLKDKYGSDFENTESSETEDEIGDLATPSMNAAILETILKIRNKDPDIYKSDVNFYENVEDELIIKEKSKPFRLNDYHRQQLLDSSKNGMEEEKKLDVSDPTYVEEQRMLKEEILTVFHGETHDDEFLTLRKKSLQEQEEEDKAYKDFLMEKVEDKVRKKILQQWINVSNKPLDESNEKSSKDTRDENFLFSYVLNRGWIDKNANRVASYDEVIKGLESDESFDEKVDEFEAKYNFRFEEEDSNQISSYSRDILSVRRKNEKRKHLREKKNQLKRIEKLKKEEEIFRLKNLKRKELMEKLNKIAQVTGDSTLKFEDIDIEGDFDPDKWSARMDKIFNEAYYSKKEKKPVFEDDTDIECIDSDYGESLKNYSDVEINSTNSQKNQMKSKKNISAVKLSKKEKEDRKRKLDFMLGQHYNVNIKKSGTFKYNKVDPYIFGLNHADILYANDAELNEFVSLKKLTPYRNKKLQEKDKKKYGKKKRLKEWRKKVWGEYLDNQDIVEKSNTNMFNDKKDI